MSRGGARPGAGRPRVRAGEGDGPRVTVELDDRSGPALLRYGQEHAVDGRPLSGPSSIRELLASWGEDAKVRRAVAAWRARRGS